MIKEMNGDIFETSDLDIIIHQANCFHVMGGGIAKIIKQRFPAVYEADLKTIRGDRNKIGSMSSAIVEYLGKEREIINLYSQYTFGGNIETIYSAMENGFNIIDKKYTNKNIGVPYKIGCGLAGGDWNTVLDLIHKCFKNNNVYICKI